MELFQGGRDRKGGRAVDDVMGVATDNSVKLPLVYVVSLALGHIKTQIIERLNNSDQVTLRSSDIRWVLTVPAIWSAFGKTFMRAAAHRGGLVDHEDDQEVRRARPVKRETHVLATHLPRFHSLRVESSARNKATTETKHVEGVDGRRF